MRKYLLILCSFLYICLYVMQAQAFMPTYDDDEEFNHCAKVSDWDTCATEETQRYLNTVKNQYRTILSNPQILRWNSEPDTNVEILRDMFDSWTAFRNRLCSLSNKAAKYAETIITEKISCNLYYTIHHYDHLNSILLLMTKKAPRNVEDFKFLHIYDHDEQYENCIKNQQANCIDQELKRSGQEIKNYYKTFLEDEFVGKWNNGPDLKRGNYRDMYDSWIAYRNRMCSLSVWAYKSFYGPQSMDMNTCLQFYNREKLETMQHLLVVAHSALDEEHENDENFGDEHIDLSADDDGGAAEGQTITPLERHNNPLLQNDDLLYPEKVDANESKKPENSEKLNIPSWAQQ